MTIHVLATTYVAAKYGKQYYIFSKVPLRDHTKHFERDEVITVQTQEENIPCKWNSNVLFGTNS